MNKSTILFLMFNINNIIVLISYFFNKVRYKTIKTFLYILKNPK